MNLRPAPVATGLSVVLLCLVAACSGSADPAKLTDQGYAALGKSDWKGAQADFGSALAALEPTDPRYLRAKMGWIEAAIYTDPGKAKDEFLALAAGMASQVKSSDYIAVASKLTGERKFPEAIAVLESGLKAHAEDPKVRAVGEAIKKAAERAGDDASLAKLKTLGYL